MADGVAVGREHGYTQGWNEATLHANSVIAERYQEIDRLSSEIHKGNAHIKTCEQHLENHSGPVSYIMQSAMSLK